MIARWRRPNPGMEEAIPAYADHVDAYMRSLISDGRIDAFEWVDSVTGSDHYMAVVRAAQPDLLAVMNSPEFQQIVVQGRLTLDGFRVDLAVAGSSFDDVWPGLREAMTAGAART